MATNLVKKKQTINEVNVKLKIDMQISDYKCADDFKI